MRDLDVLNALEAVGDQMDRRSFLIARMEILRIQIQEHESRADWLVGESLRKQKLMEKDEAELASLEE